MSERKEKTMLKWLKQKPTHGHGAIPVEKITDDPLATIQVHPNAKKSKNKANEIYAVSRVNPLFEEEEGKGVFSPGGNSGSSGYDSGSGPSDDDFPVLHNNTNSASATSTDLKDLQANIVGRLSSSNHPSAKHLFINTENDVIHHEAAIVGPNGRPVLQILEQNPNYVKSIALSVANARKRPLSPISESSQQNNNPQKANTNTQVIRSASTLIRPNSSAGAPRIYKDNAKSSTDSVGAAKLIKKDTQYVKSIRIGAPGGGGAGGTQTKRSLLEANRRFSSSSSSSSNGPSRRPSVTFADDVNGGGGSRPTSRKPSIEQDSIVTESLLMMTSGGGGATEHARRFSNASNTSSGSSTNISSRRNSVSSAQSKSQDEHSSTETDASGGGGGSPPGGDGVDLEAFANSLRKSRPIKQPNSSNRSTGSSDELDETTSSASTSSSSNPSEGYDSTTPPNERKKFEDDIPPPLPAPNNPPRTHSKSHKSPFGGIADHYAAAKEIAKEIESYSNGSAKASSKKSLVRDLLLHRSNRSIFSSNDSSKPGGGSRTSSSSAGFRGALRHGSSSPHIQQYEPQVVLAARTSSPIYYESYGTNTAHLQPPQQSSSSSDYGNNYRLSTTSTTTAAQSPASRGGSDDWELVRVQQVYVKDESSSQDQQKQQHPKSKLLLVGKGDPSLSNGRFCGGGHQGQDHSATASAATSNSRRHPSSSLATPKTSSALASSSSSAAGKTAKKILKADDGLGAGARSRLQGDEEEEDTDSGNSSDRTYAEVRLEIEGTNVGITTEDSGGGAQAIIQVEEEDPDPSNLPSKVMIVTGDSQNIVVDLARVPLDVKNAIVSGTALITLPDGLNHHLQPGYTMITIPASSSRPPSSSQGAILQAQHLVVDTHHLATLKSSSSGSGAGRGITIHNSKKEPGVMNIRIGGGDDDKPLVISAASSSDDECKLFGVKNKAQIWDVMQHTLGKQHDGGGGGAHSGKHKQKKKITTVFPFHPNQASYESPDFTIEGHRLDRQRKKVEHEKKRRCACRLCGMLFFLVAFLGVLVALSMIYTKAVWSYFFDVDQTTVAVATTEPDYYY